MYANLSSVSNLTTISVTVPAMLFDIFYASKFSGKLKVELKLFASTPSEEIYGLASTIFKMRILSYIILATPEANEIRSRDKIGSIGRYVNYRNVVM